MKGPIPGGASAGDGGNGEGRPMPADELRGILDDMSRVMVHILDRLDEQGRALAAIGAVVATLATKEAESGTSPDRVAQATAQAVRQSLVPHLAKIVGVLEELNGGKALLRERLRAMDREEAKTGRWRFHPAAVVGIPLALVLLLALAVPRAMAQTPLTCRATGGEWWEATANYPAACLFSADRDQARGS